MESLSETTWDVVISGTGFKQSLLALALSRSGKSILHVDPHEYYGGSEAAFSLQELDAWAVRNQSTSNGVGDFSSVSVDKTEDGEGLSPSRAYSIALAPQLIHTKSKLLTQLVSSKAFKQVEFLAVGSFFIFHHSSSSTTTPSLRRIPSTREDVFLDTTIAARSKRMLMKFLKFVLDYEAESQVEVWKPHADEQLGAFLATQFSLDASLQAYIIALTLSLDGTIAVRDGLSAIHRHMSSMGQFGPGFAAVYPKWGGLSEVAQVGCRASAVGGAVYMLGTGVKSVQKSDDDAESELEISLSNDVVVKSKALVQTWQESHGGLTSQRLTSVVTSSLSTVFKPTMDSAPTPAVAVVAFPSGSISTDDGEPSSCPIYAIIHSSDTGECPSGQSIIYLSTMHSTKSDNYLKKALASLLSVTSSDAGLVPSPIYQLSYVQRGDSSSVVVDDNIVNLPALTLDVAFNDSIMDDVRTAWEAVKQNDDDGAKYMQFEDREGTDDDDRFD